ncbi:MAG: DEAD/DEAH box helicase family protein [Dysgonamonadaceae bacterium]|nr:DEAD/DEAH box helicase family protein [Dysgonamonadaceae bacterium]
MNVAEYFLDTEAFIEGNTSLRVPQRRAYMALKEEFEKRPNEHKIITLPTGTGKTGVIGLSPYKISKGRVLVITPSLIIREGISDDFDTRSQFNFWTKRNVIIDDNYLPKVYRYAGYNTSGDKKRVLSYLDDSNIVIANIHKVFNTNSRKTLVDLLPTDYFDMIIIDEAHHSAAESWKRTLEHFNANKIVKLTATPFRADNKELDGKIIYEFSLADAIKDGYVKNVVAEDYTTQKLEFILDGKAISKEEALDLMDSNWVTRSVAYSEECSLMIVDMSIKKLMEKRSHGNAHHQIIAVACSIDHAKEIKKMYEDAGLSADFITSDRQEDSERAIIEFKKGQIDVLVNVNMLGEGFDHSNISVAAIFRPYRSLAPYAQFIGRALRKIQENNPIDAIDNVAHVIYHKELDLDKLWEYYTGEKAKADRRKRIELIYTNEEPIEKNFDVGEVKTQGEIVQTTKEFLTDGIGNKYKFEIQASIDLYNKEIQGTVSKMEKADIPKEVIDDFILKSKQKLEENITRKRNKLREELLREELHDAHKQRVVETVETLLDETGLPDVGTELPSNTTNSFLKKSGSNSAYCIMYINSNLKRRLKRGIDEWETYDFEQAEKLLPELLDRLKVKIERLDLN